MGMVRGRKIGGSGEIGTWLSTGGERKRDGRGC